MRDTPKAEDAVKAFDRLSTVLDYRAAERGLSLEISPALADRVTDVAMSFLAPEPVLKEVFSSLELHTHRWLSDKSPEDVKEWLAGCLRWVVTRIDTEGVWNESWVNHRDSMAFRRAQGELSTGEEYWLTLSSEDAKEELLSLLSHAVANIQSCPDDVLSEGRDAVLDLLGQLARTPEATIRQIVYEFSPVMVWSFQSHTIRDEDKLSLFKKLVCRFNGALTGIVEGVEKEINFGVVWDEATWVKDNEKTISWFRTREMLDAELRHDQTEGHMMRQRCHDEACALWQLIFQTIDRMNLLDVLRIGAEPGHLGNRFKKATFNDRIDSKRKDSAKKRRAETVSLSELSANYEGLSDEEALGREQKELAENPFEQVENKILLEQLEHEPSLTPREKELFRAEVRAAEEGHEPTLEWLGKRLGVSKERAHQIKKSAHEKLKTAYPEMTA